ncbi:hypothetical protein R5H30_03445 [Sulfitobacter sp. D35]|uniref:TadE/TadG family type IV pilus assembly protein n=1 Tax=Sulfitobacter sp. D35 TaxID=3083252 RepID=UPI00296FB1DA|nr:hypothetical protein [Sulfitobacter sp. D35]MDW4497023.1 hypothetical protein [Sulfitobacter sp. D35]
MAVAAFFVRPLRRFARSQEASIAIETVIILPALFVAFMVMYSAFDSYRQHAINQKAAYTIGDLISRQTTPMDLQFLQGARSLFDYLTRSGSESALRVTSVQWNDTDKKYELDWSKGVGAVSNATQDDVTRWAGSLPKLAPDEYITVVETRSEYDAPFRVGLQDHDMSNFVFTRPRYAPSVRWGTE